MSNLELPPPLDSEYLEIAWGINRFGEDHKPVWIARPKIRDGLSQKLLESQATQLNTHYLKS